MLVILNGMKRNHSAYLILLSLILLSLIILTLIDSNFSESNRELKAASFFELAANGNTASHEFAELLANTQTQTTAAILSCY